MVVVLFAIVVVALACSINIPRVISPCSCRPPCSLAGLFSREQQLCGHVSGWSGRSGRWGAGKGSRGENHMFPGMLGSVVGEQQEAHGHQHENSGRAQFISGWRGANRVSGLVMLNNMHLGVHSFDRNV